MVVPTGGWGAPGIEWVETRDATQQPTIAGAASGPGKAGGQPWAAAGLWSVPLASHSSLSCHRGQKYEQKEFGVRKMARAFSITFIYVHLLLRSRLFLTSGGPLVECSALPTDWRNHELEDTSQGSVSRNCAVR